MTCVNYNFTELCTIATGNILKYHINFLFHSIINLYHALNFFNFRFQ